jgi:hypothetical protein
MRKFVRIIKKDFHIREILTQKLISSGFDENTFDIIHQSALGSRTMFHEAIKQPPKLDKFD